MGVMSLGCHTRPACTQGFTRSLKLCQECRFNSCVRVFFIPMGSRGLKQWVVTSISHMGEILDSDWSRSNLLRSDWLLLIVASMTTGFYVSLTLGNLNVRSLNNLGTGGKFKEIQNANEMSRNTRLSMLSHPAIKHFAHFLFPSPLKYFSGDARKNAFFKASENRGITPCLLDKNSAKR